MKTRKHEEELADQLDAYIDRPAEIEGSQPEPAASPIVDALRLSASSVEPAPEFVERLSARLRQERAPSPSWLPRWMPDMVWIKQVFEGGLTMRKGIALTAAAAALILAIVLPLALGGDQARPPLPRLVHASEADPQSISPSLLVGADLTLTNDLPDAPTEMRVYHAHPVPVPATPEEVLALARDFGLPNPQVYRDLDNENSLVALGSHGQFLVFYQFPGARRIEYFKQIPGADSLNYDGEDTAAFDGSSLSLAQATEAAVAFLREHRVLPAAYPIYDAHRAHDLTDSLVEPDRLVQLNPELDGVPVFGGFFVWATVRPTGEVIRVGLHEPMAFEPRQVYPIKSAEQAYSELTSGQLAKGPFRLEIEGAYRIPASRPPSKVYRPIPPDWSAGQPITVTGSLTMKLVANKGGDTRALLTTRDGTSYDLTGPLVATLVASDGANMEIQGTVIAQSGSRRWQLEVTDWRVVPQRDYERLTGTLTVKGSDAWLVTDDGERYELPGLPKGLDDGERIQVIADGPLVVGRDMAWSVIHSPPPSQTKAQSDESSELDPSSLAGEQLIVESAELAYYVPQSSSTEQIVQPVWVFAGRNTNSTIYFVAHVQAVTEECVQDASVTPDRPDTE